jgi:tRNA(Arg) A34 adenosine deaminase TadA
MNHEKVLKQLRVIAEDVEPVKTARIAAAIAIGGEIISIGVNQRKTHPLQARFTRHTSAIYQHAEISAIHNALKRVRQNDLARATLYVVRRRKNTETKDWEDGMACPCEGCQKAIKYFDIKKVVYTESS